MDHVAIGGSFTEFDFESIASGTDLDTLTAGAITVDVGTGGVGGVAATAEVFVSSGFPGPTGTVESGTLLNRDSSSAPHSEITFSF